MFYIYIWIWIKQLFWYMLTSTMKKQIGLGPDLPPHYIRHWVESVLNFEELKYLKQFLTEKSKKKREISKLADFYKNIISLT